VSISSRQFRAAIFHYVDLGTDGRSDPRYVKQVNAGKSDGNWWVEREVQDSTEVVRGGKPEYRIIEKLGFSMAAPLQAPVGSHVAILMADTEEIFLVRALLRREMIKGQVMRQVKAELSHDSILTATYSDGYYYPD
jgi:hypothetical protein